jgi:DNA topoisomerase-3
VEDHHAILPTGRLPASLSPDERRIYDLVVRRLLAAYQPDCVESRTTVTAELGSEWFRAVGLVVQDLGWRRVDPPHVAHARKRDEDADRALPALRAGESLVVEDLEVKARKTKPPRPFSEAELLAAMEGAGKALDDDELRAAMRDGGLGTPATRASILENLLDREYLRRERRQLRATPKGIALIQALPVAALRSPALTGEWEAKLARMARGEYARDQFMAEIRAWTAALVAQLKAAAPPRIDPGATSAPPPRHKKRAASRRSAMPSSGSPAAVARRPPGPAPAATPPRPPAPERRPCPSCRRPARVLWSDRRSAWFQRCDGCARWLP